MIVGWVPTVTKRGFLLLIHHLLVCNSLGFRYTCHNMRLKLLYDYLSITSKSAEVQPQCFVAFQH